MRIVFIGPDHHPVATYDGSPCNAVRLTKATPPTVERRALMLDLGTPFCLYSFVYAGLVSIRQSVRGGLSRAADEARERILNRHTTIHGFGQVSSRAAGFAREL